MLKEALRSTLKNALPIATYNKVRYRIRCLVRFTSYPRKLWESRNPQTFTEKLRYKMCRDHRPILTTFADRSAVRGYVAERVGTGVLPKIYAEAKDCREIQREKLPENFVVKLSHGSGGVLIVWDKANPANQMPAPDAEWFRTVVTPQNVSWDKLVDLFNRGLTLPFSSPFDEWAYTRIPPRILVEELLLDETGSLPNDYKLFVIGGVCRMIQVDAGRHTDHHRDLFLPDWTLLDVEYAYPRSGKNLPAPKTLSEMIRIAEALGKGVDFVRVDLYDLGDRIVFGELTNYPDGGVLPFKPKTFDRELGAFWELPARYN